MSLTTVELSEASQAAAALLEELGLDAYLFEVEPHLDAEWELQVECAVDEGWQRLCIPIDKEALLASRHDEARRRELMDEWRERLGTCKVRYKRAQTR